MDFGFALPGRGSLATPEILTKLARRADELHYSSIFVTDHVVIPASQNAPYPYSPTGKFAGDWKNGYLEPLTLMSYLAGETSRVRLGTSVLVIPYRNPVVTAKMLATLDVLSGGRVILGAGVGWFKEEFEALHAEPFERRGAGREPKAVPLSFRCPLEVLPKRAKPAGGERQLLRGTASEVIGDVKTYQALGVTHFV